MTTSGVLSIVKDEHTFIKVVVGCYGFNVDNVAFAINDLLDSGDAVTAKTIYELSLSKWGCENCLVVMDATTTIGKEELASLYRETFDQPRFNPDTTGSNAGNIVRVVQWRPPIEYPDETASTNVESITASDEN